MTARDDVAALLIKSVLNHLQTKYKSRFALDVGEVAGHKSKERVHLLSLVQYYRILHIVGLKRILGQNKLL